MAKRYFGNQNASSAQDNIAPGSPLASPVSSSASAAAVTVPGPMYPGLTAREVEIMKDVVACGATCGFPPYALVNMCIYLRLALAVPQGEVPHPGVAISTNPMFADLISVALSLRKLLMPVMELGPCAKAILTPKPCAPSDLTCPPDHYRQVLQSNALKAAAACFSGGWSGTSDCRRALTSACRYLGDADRSLRGSLALRGQVFAAKGYSISTGDEQAMYNKLASIDPWSQQVLEPFSAGGPGQYNFKPFTHRVMDTLGQGACGCKFTEIGSFNVFGP